MNLIEGPVMNRKVTFSNFNYFYALFVLLASMLALNIIFIGKASANTFPDNYATVSNYGTYSHIDASGRFSLKGTDNGNNYDIRIIGACVNTSAANTPGLIASYNGGAPRGCSGGSDIVINNVQQGHQLVVNRPDGRTGHQSYRVTATGPGAEISNTKNPNRRNSSWGAADRSYGYAQWGGQLPYGGRMAVDCSDRRSESRVYIKWKDADDSSLDNGNGDVFLNIYGIEITPAGRNRTLEITIREDQVPRAGGDNEEKSYGITVEAQYSFYEVEWVGVRGTNAVYMALPYEFSDAAENCEIEPRGRIQSVSCNNSRIRGWAVDDNWRNSRHVQYRLKIDNNNTSNANTGEIANGTGTANQNHGYVSGNDFSSTVNVAQYFPTTQTHTFYLQGRDIRQDGSTNTASWVNLDSSRQTKNCGSTDHAPTGAISGSCNGINVGGIGDQEDDGDGVQVIVKAYRGSGGPSASNPGQEIFVGRMTGDRWFPIPSEDNANGGWVFELYIYNVLPGGAQAPFGHALNSRQLTGATGACVSVTCQTASLTTGAVPGATNGVRANQDFTVRVLFRNNGGARGDAVLRSPLSSGQRISARIYADPNFGTVTQAYGGGDIPALYNYEIDMVIRAPSDIGTYTTNIYADYPDYLAADTASCPITVNVYRPFQLIPDADIPIADNLENPENIEYATSIEQASTGSLNGSPYYTSPVNATATSSLMYYNQGNRDDPLLDENVRAGTYGTADWDESDGNEWNDTPLPGRQFDHGGETGTWRAGDRFCSRLTIDPSVGWVGPASDVLDTSPASDTDCSTSGNRPYVRTYGGDVFAGGQFGTAGGNPNAGVLTYYKNATGAGSGGEFAALALGTIEGYNTASLRTASAPLPPLGLAFSNTTAGSSGHYTASRAVPDYFAEGLKPETVETPATNINPNSGSFANGEQTLMRSGSALNISGGTGYNKRHAFFIEGDVVISDNITYSTNPWVSFDDVPSFRIYVKGNIYITNNVSKLEGMFVAQPRADGSGGTIYTCAQSNTNLYSQTELYTNCNNQLKVDGAFVAQNLKLLRTFNTLTNAENNEEFNNSNAAEVFRLSPDLFLSVPAIRPQGSQANGDYDYFVSLPPVL